YINCGNLCIVATHKVNGVAALHSKLLKKKEFPLFNISIFIIYNFQTV
nr:glycogen/starch/alpha-glucan phosphorylase [bacterium]